MSPEDIPFTEFGVVPDLIVNPHAIPSRMSIGQVLEMVAGKAGCLEGERIDATPFNKSLEDEIKQQLIDNGFEHAGCESLYSGVTGERLDAEIFRGEEQIEICKDIDKNDFRSAQKKLLEIKDRNIGLDDITKNRIQEIYEELENIIRLGGNRENQT